MDQQPKSNVGIAAALIGGLAVAGVAAAAALGGGKPKPGLRLRGSAPLRAVAGKRKGCGCGR